MDIMTETTDVTEFVRAINKMAAFCYDNSAGKGFWDDFNEHDPLHWLGKLALIHSEVSEALEAVRKGDWDNFEEEMADVCIRVFDILGYLEERDLGVAIIDKMRRNKRRPFKHGKTA